ncbi:MAG: UvrD-helicase domain-containing protein [Patescibacteria group bacterium]|nr:UvrD-helicase domain-containing protein [Patescibacteria group bacterium]MDE2438518.1 UvrD-helicase domain-containing protein [Patescibacteria group bacterium]
MDKNELLKGLNASQRNAVETIGGPLLVVAGAGSGKTKTLTHRIAYLIASGVDPSSILAVTFTNKAAKEMKTRVQTLIAAHGLVTAPGFIGTFHSLGAKLLREEAMYFKRTPYFSISDKSDSLSLIKSITKELNLDKEKFPPQAILAAIGLRKNGQSKGNNEHNFFESIVSNIQAKYEDLLITNNAFDFDDLIMKPATLFAENPELLRKYQARWHYILIDEYQDINPVQYSLMKQLAEHHRNICAVGDDAQSIYSWRGADFTIFLDFERDWPGASLVLLEENYRSTQTILTAANAVIAHNSLKKDKNLFTRKEAGPPIYVIEADNDIQEAAICIDTIAGLAKNNLSTLEQVAVLYRTNAQSRVLEEACIRARLPYQMVGGTKFYDRKEIKDLLAYLTLAINPNDTISLERIINVPARGLGKEAVNILRIRDTHEREEALGRYRNKKSVAAFLEFIHTLQEKMRELPLVQVLRFLTHELKFQEYLSTKTEEGIKRWENVQELVNAASHYDTRSTNRLENGVAFLETANLYQDADALHEHARGITLMTIHAAKGLEFETVFLVGLEEGILPHERSLTEESALEEERRLAYVALTRAKKTLYILFARSRKVFGSFKMNLPSRFLAEIPDTLVEYTNATSAKTYIDEDFIEYN